MTEASTTKQSYTFKQIALGSNINQWIKHCIGSQETLNRDLIQLPTHMHLPPDERYPSFDIACCSQKGASPCRLSQTPASGCLRYPSTPQMAIDGYRTTLPLLNAGSGLSQRFSLLLHGTTSEQEELLFKDIDFT